MFNANGASGVPIPVMLDIPPDIYARIESGELVREGGVVRSAATMAIVKHLKEGSFSTKEVVNSVAQCVWSSKEGKIAVVRLIGVALGVVVAAGEIVANQWSDQRRSETLNAALIAYLNAAETGEVTVEQIDALSSAIEAARGKGSSDSVLIAEKIVSLVEGYTVALAQANKTTWEPERDTNVVPLVRLESSLSAQRRIFGAAARDTNVGRPQTFAWGRPTFPSSRMFRAPLRLIDQPRQTKRFR